VPPSHKKRRLERWPEVEMRVYRNVIELVHEDGRTILRATPELWAEMVEFVGIKGFVLEPTPAGGHLATLPDFNPLSGASRGVGRCTCPCGKGTDPGCPVHP
jgi:hypothetical protein